MEIIDLESDIEMGILIHQIPNELIGKAIEVLPTINRKSFDEFGLRVYFSSKSKCNELIRKKFIVLDGIPFNIYSTVTCLTVFDIYSSLYSDKAIKSYVEDIGMRVFDLYRIKNTNHCRIILDVPEVLANFHLSPISLDSGHKVMHPIVFFCRTCENEGHKQYQCRQSMREMRGADDTGNGIGGTSSNNARTSRQENNVNPSVSADAATPSTSRMATDAETYLRDFLNDTTGSYNVGYETPRTHLIRPVTDTQSSPEQKYPCKEIVAAVNKVHGPVPSKRLLKFLEVVYKKQQVFKYVMEFTASFTDISGLAQQIKMVLSQLYEENHRSDIAKRHIKVLESLCIRLRDN